MNVKPYRKLEKKLVKNITYNYLNNTSCYIDYNTIKKCDIYTSKRKNGFTKISFTSANKDISKYVYHLNEYINKLFPNKEIYTKLIESNFKELDQKDITLYIYSNYNIDINILSGYLKMKGITI